MAEEQEAIQDSDRRTGDRVEESLRALVLDPRPAGEVVSEGTRDEVRPIVLRDCWP